MPLVYVLAVYPGKNPAAVGMRPQAILDTIGTPRGMSVAGEPSWFYMALATYYTRGEDREYHYHYSYNKQTHRKRIPLLGDCIDCGVGSSTRSGEAGGWAAQRI